MEKEPRTFSQPEDTRLSRLQRILRSKPPTLEQLQIGLAREVAPLVSEFAERLRRQEGLRNNIIVGPPCPRGE